MVDGKIIKSTGEEINADYVGEETDEGGCGQGRDDLESWML